MSKALLIGMEGETARRLLSHPQLEDVRFEVLEAKALEVTPAHGDAEPDAFLIGERVADPIAAAQHARRWSRDAAVLVFPEPERLEQTRRAIAIAPFIGSNTRCAPIPSTDEAMGEVRNELRRATQRRKHRSVLEALATVPAATGAFRPRAAHVLDRVLEHAPIGILAVDAGRTVVLANPAAQRLLGQELVGAPLLSLFSGELAALARALEAAQSDRSTQVVLGGSPGGSPQTLELTVAPLPMQSEAGVLVMIQDVTEQAELDRHRTAALRQLNEALRLRDEFLAVAAHELKTPLTPLRLRLQVLRRDLELLGAAPPVQQRLESAERQTSKLNQLVEGLLDVSRLATGRLTLSLEPVDLAAVARETAHQHEQLANQAGCSITLDAPEPVVGEWDRLRLDQVVTALVTNALKYGAAKPVTLQVRRDGPLAILSVADQGIGISAADQERIFHRFERAVSENHYGGLGLGLYIASHIVQALGGRISVESAPGEGARFTVELPLRRGEREAAKSPGATSGG